MLRSRTAGAALACVLLAGCGDSAGPAEFDAVQAQADIHAFLDDAGSTQMDLMSTGFEKIEELLQAGAIPSVSRQGTGPSFSAMAMPDTLKGTTFEYDIASEGYLESARVGAPADGMRFILYGVDGAGDFAAPLAEVGYVDIRDQDDGDRRQMRLVMVVAEATVADYVSWATGDEDSGRYGFEGYLMMAGHRVDMDVAGWSDPSGSGRRDSIETRIELGDRDFVVEGNLMLDDDGTLQTGTFMVDYQSRGGNVLLEAADNGTTSTRSVALNGEAYAASSGPTGSTPDYSGVGPHTVTEADATFFAEVEQLNILGYQMATVVVTPVWRLIAPFLMPG